MPLSPLIEQILLDFLDAAVSASTPEAIEALRQRFIGRKSGRLTMVLRSLKEASPAERRTLGQQANDARKKMEQTINQLQQRNVTAHQGADLTLPGIPPVLGHAHPMTQVMNELMDIFIAMGFMVVEGQELENDFYNFEALNIPKGHPARDIQDTFFVQPPIHRVPVRGAVVRGKQQRQLQDEQWLLRTHTSPMQVRMMEQHTPPLRCIVPGRVFRNEATDATHEHTFYQLEGLVVDKNVSVGQLIWTLREIFRQFYKQDVKVRLRPGYFPFTEPSYEPDLSCTFCQQQNPRCTVCKGTGWIEMGGSGMVHPSVFAAAGYPKGKYTGFAFGMGPNRLAMLKYGITDIRQFMANDVRFLEQF